MRYSGGTLLFTIATGEAYRKYATDMFESATKFWPRADRLVFTDKPFEFPRINALYTEPKGYPRETLMRYHTLLSAAHLVEKYEHVFYCDADMLFVDTVGNIESPGLVATLHPGYYGRKGTPETRFLSTAYCPGDRPYYAGGFQGGRTDHYLTAAHRMGVNIETDEKNGILATWHDESHWNKYLSDFPTQIAQLTPSYCYPEDYAGQWGWAPDQFKPILVALNKKKRGNHWSQK